MKVLKFGGTSVGSTEMIKKTAEIIINSKKNDDVVIVVSAMTKVTNSLFDICDNVGIGNMDNVLAMFQILKEKHLNVAKDLSLDGNYEENSYFLKLNQELINLEDILKGATILKNLTDNSKAKILYYGEILSSILVSFAINNLGVKSNNYLSKNLIICEGSYMNSECDFIKSEDLMGKWIEKINLSKEIPVITGFGGGDDEGDVYLFDRGGSDYVGSLVGRFLKANSIEIWTDVDGIMSADPRTVKNPILWDELDYAVCAEFALVGAKVLHPKTISPAQEKFIPVYIKNTFNPTAKGTKICKKIDKGLKGINIDSDQVLLNFIDPTMIGGYGYVYHVVKILYDEKISIDAIATTETSFSISIKSKSFSKELSEKFFGLHEHFQINIYENVTKISFVGDTINDYTALSYIEDEIIMVTGGAYGKSLTAFVKTDDAKGLLVKLHDKVFSKK
ncbi:MAG: aspartate kinase [Candidatus Gracilibacteria bacterium]|nr:aspartate kinase [Candidatus Gracilibacteria bacterium]